MTEGGAGEIIRAEGLAAAYGGRDGKPALLDISFKADAGERIALMGANGAGKSTLLFVLSGVIPPLEGSLAVNGIPVDGKNLRELRKTAGLVFQNPDDQIFMPTVEDDVSFGPRNYGAGGEETGERVRKTLEALGIGNLAKRLAHHLSGGEKRLVALAGILVMEPALLLLDEPLAFLDTAARRRLLAVLSGLSQTMIIATHDADLARTLCRRCILLQAGRIRADGPVDQVLADGARLEEWGL
ncbi:MAG: energy-coupling factor ABC transporter ATP-binding protein [Treponema sp.]|nr:energy-coupling factor ABC transporter ATP-binding protein [Treponema sp.]